MSPYESAHPTISGPRGPIVPRFVTLLAVLIAMLALGRPAVPIAGASGPTTVTFDDLAAGSTVTTQYANVGGTGRGVVFGALPAGQGSGLLPVVASVPTGQAQSGTQVANISTCFGCEFYTPFTTSTFTYPRQHVSVFVGQFGSGPPSNCTPGDTGNDCAVLTLQAFDSNGTVVAQSDAVTVAAGAGFHTLLAADSTSANIVGFEISARAGLDASKQIGIDDLTFDNPSSPPPADFSLTSASTGVEVMRGSSGTVGFTISRVPGSSGNIQFGISGLSTGVGATFTPNPAGGNSTTLTLTAANDAPVTKVNATITATPLTPSAGSASHSDTIVIDVVNDFSVSVDGSPDVDLSACTVKVPIVVERGSFSFFGPVHLSLSGLPNSVQAAFDPPSLTFPAGGLDETSTLTLTASASGISLPLTTVVVHAASPPHPEKTVTLSLHGACPAAFDVQVNSIQVTQGIQVTGLPARNPKNPVAYVPYRSVPGAVSLLANRQTIVRVYANARIGPAGGVPNVGARLHVYAADHIFGIPTPIRGKELPGSPLLPIDGTRTLQVGPSSATLAEETDPGGAYTFVVPANWTSCCLLYLTAELVPPHPGQTSPSVWECAGCQWNNTFTLSEVPFTLGTPVSIAPVAMTTFTDVGNGIRISGVLPDPAQVFARARQVTPLPVTVKPYVGVIDITDIANDPQRNGDQKNQDVLGRLDDFDCANSNNLTTDEYHIGVNTGIARGVEHRHLLLCGNAGIQRDAVVDTNRPLTSVTHEWFHILGRPHASKCTNGGGDPTVGELGAEDWPPDQMGYIQGIGLDDLPGSGGTAGPFKILYPGLPGQPAQWYDLMSYCAMTNDSDAWVSVHNWNAILGSLQAARAAAATAAVPQSGLSMGSVYGPTLRIEAFLRDSHVRIAAVEPGFGVAAGGTHSPYHVIVQDGQGRVVSDTPMISDLTHIDHAGVTTALEARVPASGAASVKIVRDGKVVAARRRSPHPPAVTILSPQDGGLVGRAATVAVRWQARDADRDPLVVTIDYSPDNGHSWRTIFIGPNDLGVALPRTLFSPSDNARLRIRVNDGFNETVQISGRIMVHGPSIATRTTTTLQVTRS